METSILKINNHQMCSGLSLPRLFFGISGFESRLDGAGHNVAYEVIKECLQSANGSVVFDSSGKYGAGRALETLGNCLRLLNVPKDKVIICNRLGWLRTESGLKAFSTQPGLEHLKYDVVHKIGYDGILECFEQGNELLGGYVPQMVAVQDPDEYFAKAENWQQKQQRYENILDAFEALFELKHQGKVKAIGVTAKDWRLIERLAGDVPLDWVSITGSDAVKSNPKELLDFIHELNQNGIWVNNSGLTDFSLNHNNIDVYRKIKTGTREHDALYRWRKEFFEVCQKFGVEPAAASVQFALHVLRVKSVTLDMISPEQIAETLEMVKQELPAALWEMLFDRGLVI